MGMASIATSNTLPEGQEHDLRTDLMFQEDHLDSSDHVDATDV